MQKSRELLKKTIKIQLIFLIYFILLIKGMIAQTNMDKINKTDETSFERILHVLCSSHLDTQWRWDYRKTIREYILNTLKDNFALFEKYPHYNFNFSGSNRYRMMKEYYPKEYELMKKYIDAGRWFVCGSSVEESDVLVPSSESIVRHILYGNSYFRKEFGKESFDYMLPDCFGFPASLPTILSHCGVKGFSTQKLTWGSAVGIPFNIGLWEGTDGNSIVSVFNPGEYVAQIREDLSKSKTWLDRIDLLGKTTGIYKEYMYAGTGDVGGAPAEESIKMLEESINSNGPIKVLSVPGDKFFKEISTDETSKLPKYKGELLLTNHSAGSLTSAAYMKRWNRKNELLAYSSEMASVIGDWLSFAYPTEKIKEAWRLVQAAQFHDILPGTSIPKAYEYSWNDEVLAMNQFSGILSDASGVIINNMDTQVKGVPLVVYNPLAYEREDIVQATIEFPEMVKFISVHDEKGKELPSQITKKEHNKITFIFLTNMPSAGYKIFDIRRSSEPCKIVTGLNISNSTLENNNYKIFLNSAGDVSGIYDKLANCEILSDAHRLAFLNEKPREYPAWNMDWEDRKNPPIGYVDGAAKIKIIEHGPVRISIEIERDCRGSNFIQQIRLSAGAAGSKVEFNNSIEWFTESSSLKAVFPLKVSNPLASYNTGAGVIQRGNNDPKKFEVPSHQWFDLTDKENKYGVSILEDCKYGSDKPDDHTIRLTLLYTPTAKSDFKDQASQEFGKHEFIYALYGHKGDWRTGKSYQIAERLNQPLISFETKPHDGSFGKIFSFMKISNESVILKALKKSEDGKSYIIRVQETTGKKSEKVNILFYSPILKATEVNGQEEYIGEVIIEEGKLVFDMLPNSIRTFSINIKESRKADLAKCNPLELNYNSYVFSADDEKIEAGINEKSYPSELVPDEILSGGIKFKLGSKVHGNKNALICKGQSIKLPSGKYNNLYILAAAEDDTEGVFLVDGIKNELKIQKWNGFIGNWDNRIWDGEITDDKPDYFWGVLDYIGIKPGFIKRDNVAHFTTHTHQKDGKNCYYDYGYMYKYNLKITQNSKLLVLPVNEKIRILAVTIAYNENDNIIPANYLYDTLNHKLEDYKRFQLCSRPVASSESYIIEEKAPLEVKLSSKDLGVEIRYTVDGSEPNEKSPVYSKPLLFKETTLLKAAAFKSDKCPSKTMVINYYKAYRIKDIKHLLPYSDKYTGSGDRTLIDSVRAGKSYQDKAWLGYESSDLEVVLDLGEIRNVKRVTAGCLNNNSSWIFLPLALEVGVSDTLDNFKPVGALNFEIPKEDNGQYIKDLSLLINDVKARYIHVKVKNLSKCPEWHPGAGLKAWLFVDEIIVE